MDGDRHWKHCPAVCTCGLCGSTITWHVARPGVGPLQAPGSHALGPVPAGKGAPEREKMSSLRPQGGCLAVPQQCHSCPPMLSQASRERGGRGEGAPREERCSERAHSLGRAHVEPWSCVHAQWKWGIQTHPFHKALWRSPMAGTARGAQWQTRGTQVSRPSLGAPRKYRELSANPSVQCHCNTGRKVAAEL